MAAVGESWGHQAHGWKQPRAEEQKDRIGGGSG